MSRPKRIDEVGDKVFFGLFFDGAFFVFYDDFVIGNFDDFFAGDEELWVKETFDEGALHYELLDGEILTGDGEILDATEFGTLFRLDFEPDEVEIELENVFDLDNVVIGGELVDRVDDAAKGRVFANRLHGEDAAIAIDEGTGDAESEDFKGVRVHNEAGDEGDAI